MSDINTNLKTNNKFLNKLKQTMQVMYKCMELGGPHQMECMVAVFEKSIRDST